MKQIPTILNLCTSNVSQPFCEIIRSVLMSQDAREVSSQPGIISVHDVLANLRIHHLTTSRAGANTIGMPESIQKLERMSQTDELLCFCFAVDSRHLIGNCYTDINATELIACYFVERRPQKPDAIISVRFRTPEENGRDTAVEGDHYSCPLFVDGEGFDCRLLLDGRRLELGVSYEVPIKFLFPELVLPKLTVGKEVTLWEGKEVAVGSVIKLFPEGNTV